VCTCVTYCGYTPKPIEFGFVIGLSDSITVRNDTLIAIIIVTGSIARSAKRRYLSHSEAALEVFRPAGATRYTHGGKVPSSVPNFTHIGATIRV